MNGNGKIKHNRSKPVFDANSMLKNGKLKSVSNQTKMKPQKVWFFVLFIP